MERFLLGLAVLAILVTVLRTTSEHMTNKDLMDTLKTFGEHGTSSTKKKTSSETNELPLYGPKGVPSPPAPKPTPSSGGKSGAGSSQYPEVYGPDIVLTPGKPHQNGKETSDSVTDPTYDFNPDLKNAFPTETNEPQPYLNDFSKIQR